MAGSDRTNGLAATVGGNIRTARKRAGMSQSELARALGLSDAMAVSRWERGAHSPNDTNLVALADLLVGGDVGFFYRREAA
jgi:transcriptional regulator with XRE-family HTH domain